MNVIIDKINRKEALKYLAYKGGNIDAATTALMDKCEKKLLDAMSPKYALRIFEIEEITEDEVRFKDCAFKPRGKDIVKHLQDCEKAALICATAGAGVDSYIRTVQISDMAEAVIADAMSGSAVEQVCAAAEDEIKKLFPDMFLTWRFSPGYGDFPIEQQGDFAAAVNAGRTVGVFVSESFLLTPKKSVTAILGISGKLKRDKTFHDCAVCPLKGRCNYVGSD